MLEKSSGMTAMTIAATITIAILIIGPSFLSYNAEAIPVTHGVFGTGIGTIICPDRTQLNNAQINVFFDKSAGKTVGSIDVSTGFVVGSGDLFAGFLGQGQVTNNKFSVSGVGAPIPNYTTNLCTSSVTPTNIFVNGPCGQGVTIRLQAADGTQGSFIGNVFCNRFTQ
jgi:hypothetical protein